MKPEHSFLLGITLILAIGIALALATTLPSTWQQWQVVYYIAFITTMLIFYSLTRKHETKTKK